MGRPKRLQIVVIAAVIGALPACGGEMLDDEGPSEDGITTYSASTGRIVGVIDGIRTKAGKPHLAGWACHKGHDASIRVHLYLGGRAGAGAYARQTTANADTESAVNRACATRGGVKHRFYIRLDDLAARHGGQTIWVHGIDPNGRGPNPTLHGSGRFKVPRSSEATPPTPPPSSPASVSHNPGMTKRRIRSRRVPDTGYQYRSCPDGCGDASPAYLFHVVAEQGPRWYSAISGHPHAQSPAYAPGHIHRGIAGVSGVAVNHYWIGSGAGTEAYLATNAFPQTIGHRAPDHYLFNGIFESSHFGGPKPHLRRLWQHFRLRLKKRTSGGRPDDDYRVSSGISWTDTAGRRYIIEINLASSDNSAGWCVDRIVCNAGSHHGSVERYITMGGTALGHPSLEGARWSTFGIHWGAIIGDLLKMTCDVDGAGKTRCLPSYALDFDGRDASCTFHAGVSSETRGYGFTEIGVADLDLRQ